MDQEQQIAYRAGGTLVCQYHVTDDHLREWIGDNPVGMRCDFCDRTSDAAFSADLGELALFIFEGFERDWTDAANELPPGIGYDSTRTTLEMLYEEEVTDESKLADARRRPARLRLGSA